MSQNVYIGMTLKPWPILLDHYIDILKEIDRASMNVELTLKI